MTVKNRLAKNPPTIDIGNMPLLLDETRAAEILGMSVSYLRKSRCEGEKNPEKIRSERNSIYDNPAPPFVVVNKNTIRYRKVDLYQWVKNLKQRTTI